MGRRADDALAAQREVLFGTVAFQMVLTVEQAGHDGINGLVGGTAHHSIHLGDLLLDLAAVTLSQAAGDDDLQLRVLLLVGASLQNVLNGLGLGALDESAGVDHHDLGVGAVAVEEDLVSGGGEPCHQMLAVDGVLRTAERYDVNFFHGRTMR